MKTSHQLARELLALPDIPVYHFDPSRGGMDDERDTSVSDPKAELVTEEGFAPFITICGEHSGSVSDEPGDFAEKTIEDLLESKVITRDQLEAAHSRLLAKEEARK